MAGIQMPGGRRRGGVILVLVLAAGPGCAWSPKTARDGSELLRSPLGPVLEKLWGAHGGLEAWRRWDRARFRMVIAGEPADTEIPPEEVEINLHVWDRMLVGPEGDRVLRDLGSDPDPARVMDGFDYHLRTARLFFHLPFSLAEPGWEFRRDIIPGVEDPGTAVGFWAIPKLIPSPHAGYYLVVDPRTGLLRTVFYQVRHPRFAGKIFAAEYRRYQEVGGVLMAAEIVHRLVQAVPGTAPGGRIRPVDPFDPGRFGGDSRSEDEDPFAPGFTWVLRFEDIRLEEKVD